MRFFPGMGATMRTFFARASARSSASAATFDTTTYVMGQLALEVTADVLDNKFAGGWVETPTNIVDSKNVLDILRHPDSLYPAPSKSY